MRAPARIAFILTLLTPAAPVTANEPPGLTELARKADFVALVQVRDTDYLRRRELPVSGSAYLRVLIPYKTARGTTASPRPDDAPPGGAASLVEVYEKGLHEAECYFPDPGVFEEGRRYIAFLRHDPDDAARYRGLPEGCAIDVLVDQDNGYAVRMPVTGMRLTAAQTALLEQRTRSMRYSDPYAVVDDEDLPPARRDALRAAGQIAPYGPRQWIYTRGVPLSEFRELLEKKGPDTFIAGGANRAPYSFVINVSGPFFAFLLRGVANQPVAGLVGVAARQLHAVLADEGGEQRVQ